MRISHNGDKERVLGGVTHRDLNPEPSAYADALP